MSARCPEIVLMGFRGGFVFDIQGCERYYRSGVCVQTHKSVTLSKKILGVTLYLIFKDVKGTTDLVHVQTQICDPL